jgi:RNA polymerase sigma factor (sigma-70 family)
MNLTPPLREALRTRYTPNTEQTAQLIKVAQSARSVASRSDATVELFLRNIRLVARVIARFSARRLGHGIDDDDLLQEAYRAFERALQSYDPHRGALSTLIVKAISTHLRRYISNLGYEIRIPVAQHSRLRRITFARQSGHQVHTDRATVARISGLTEEQIRYVEHLPRVALSLDDQISPDDARTVDEAIRFDDATFDPIVLLDHDRLLQLLEAALDGTTVAIVRDIYGLNDRREPLTASEAAARHNTTRGAVKRAVASALTVLQTPYYLAEIRRLLHQEGDDGDDDLR